MDGKSKDRGRPKSREVFCRVREREQKLFGNQVSIAITFHNARMLTRCASLAHAELYMTLAAIFRNFDFELYQTDLSDVELAHDFFLPSPRLDSKGVRVKVKPA